MMTRYNILANLLHSDAAGNCSAGELHLVHYNVDLYDEPAKAMSGENGLAVVGVLLKVS